MKFKKGEQIIESNDENVFSVFIREGFEPIEGEDSEKAELVKEAKKLGIKGAHLMSIETLKEKIEELNK
jgi:hypothetical protein